jgi:hypothetical protein
MLSAYFDEAISDELSLTTIAGWVATVRQWEAFEMSWRIFLSRYDVPYLHMKEYAHFKGPFEKWENRRLAGTRRNFISDAIAIVKENIQWGFICYADQRVFNKVNIKYRLDGTFRSPYSLLGWSSISCLRNWMVRSMCTTEPKCVFDDGIPAPEKAGLVEAVGTLEPLTPTPIFEASRDIAPCPQWPSGRRGLVQLQSADLLAYEARKSILDMLQKRQGRGSFKAMPFGKIDTLFYTEAGLKNTCVKLNIKKRA